MRARNLFLLAAIASAAACSTDQPTEPLVSPGGAADGALEASAIQSTGITSDQANASSVFASAGALHETNFHVKLPEFLCVFNAVSGRVECPDVSVGGLVFTRSMAFYTASGTPQPRKDTLTTRVNTRTSVKGTVTRDSITLVLDRSSDLTQDGIQRGSTRRTLNGHETGTSEVTVRTAAATYRSTVSHADTTQNLVMAHNDSSAPKWPLSGTIIRVHSGSRATVGSTIAPKTFSRREVMTFDGTSTVRIVITVNGVTRNCTRDLSRRSEPVCS